MATDLQAGERVRLISGKGEGVYGREVKDFRTLDYDAVAALNVSATQQLKREKDAEVGALRAECAGLKAANEAFVKRLNNLESKVEAALSPAASAADGAGRKL